MESSACRRRASDAEQTSAPAECEPAMVKEEPEWGECGASEAAVAEDLYAGHEVKDELVIGPELIQKQDITSIHNVCQPEPKPAGGVSAARDGCSSRRGDSPRSTSTGQPCGLKRYLVKLRRLPVRDQHSNAPSSVSRGCKPDQLMTDSNEEQEESKISFVQISEQNKLTRLMLRYTAEYRYQCKDCDERFKEISDYRSHLRKHSIKLYSCDFCNKQLKCNHNLTEHVRIHTGEKPHSCDVCNKRFSHRASFAYHKQSVCVD